MNASFEAVVGLTTRNTREAACSSMPPSALEMSSSTDDASVPLAGIGVMSSAIKARNERSKSGDHAAAKLALDQADRLVGRRVQEFVGDDELGGALEAGGERPAEGQHEDRLGLGLGDHVAGYRRGLDAHVADGRRQPQGVGVDGIEDAALGVGAPGKPFERRRRRRSRPPSPERRWWRRRLRRVRGSPRRGDGHGRQAQRLGTTAPRPPS